MGSTSEMSGEGRTRRRARQTVTASFLTQSRMLLASRSPLKSTICASTQHQLAVCWRVTRPYHTQTPRLQSAAQRTRPAVPQEPRWGLTMAQNLIVAGLDELDGGVALGLQVGHGAVVGRRVHLRKHNAPVPAPHAHPPSQHRTFSVKLAPESSAGSRPGIMILTGQAERS
eukprot:3941547-Rhodomonas_salina.2